MTVLEAVMAGALLFAVLILFLLYVRRIVATSAARKAFSRRQQTWSEFRSFLTELDRTRRTRARRARKVARANKGRRK